tara:strand:+ start:1198 stop:1950 length:753 start_codon:yes stop_codon:yes gene_type:complete
MGFAQQNIETIQLNHRLAVEVLPEIQAFLPEKSTARAFNNSIIVKAEQDVIRDIKQLIHKLDTPPQRLRITVLKTFDVLHDMQNSQIAADIDVHDRDISGSVSLHTWSTKDTKNNEQFYRAQGLTNQPISISMANDIPQSEQYLILRHDGNLAVQTETSYLNIDSGFKAVARILPNQHVILDVHPRFSEFSNQSGIINSSQIITSLSGPIGTWLELGQIDNEKNIRKYGTTTYRSHDNKQQHIYIKVDQL